MRRVYCTVAGAILYGLLGVNSLAGMTPTAQNEVQYLLEFVASSGCIFVRNGAESSAQDAADHLRLKYSRGKRYVSSSEQFIDRLASESSWTGKRYTINCAGDITESGLWLHRALNEYRSRQD